MGFVLMKPFSIIAARIIELWEEEIKKQRKARSGKVHLEIPESASPVKLPQRRVVPMRQAKLNRR